MQCCICFKWIHLRYSQLSLSKFRALGSSHSWSCAPTSNTMTSYSDSDLYTSTVQSGPFLLMLHSRPTLVFKLLISHLPILSLLLLSPHHRPLLLAVLLRLLLSLAPLNPSGFFKGMLAVSEPGALNCYTSFCPTPLTLSVSQESNLNSSSSFRIPGFSALRSDCTHFRSGILSCGAIHASGGVIIFVKHSLSFSELSISSLSSLDPYSDYVEVNIFLNQGCQHLSKPGVSNSRPSELFNEARETILKFLMNFSSIATFHLRRNV